MNKKNEDLLQSIQRMEEKIKNLTRENVEMVSCGPLGPSPDTPFSVWDSSALNLPIHMFWVTPAAHLPTKHQAQCQSQMSLLSLHLSHIRYAVGVCAQRESDSCVLKHIPHSL